MVFSTLVHQSIVSNIKSTDLNTVTTVPKMVSNVGVCCHRIIKRSITNQIIPLRSYLFVKKLVNVAPLIINC